MSQESCNVASAILTARNQKKFENWIRRNKLKEERAKERAAKMLEWEKSQAVILAEKYGVRWHWKVKDTIEDSGYADGLRYRDECEEMRKDERAFQEERCRLDHIFWERENKEREERMAAMTEEEKKVEEEEWDDRLEAAIEDERNALGYCRYWR
jgi:hypothetical protein